MVNNVSVLDIQRKVAVTPAVNAWIFVQVILFTTMIIIRSDVETGHPAMEAVQLLSPLVAAVDSVIFENKKHK